MGRVKKPSPAQIKRTQTASAAAQATYAARKPLHRAKEPTLRGAALAGLVHCNCLGSNGVAARSLEQATLPCSSAERRRGVKFYDAAPAQKLNSFIIGEGAVPQDLVGELEAFAQSVRRDDTIVREGGCGPALVHLTDTQYPSCWRVTMGVCYKSMPGTASLAAYSQNYCPRGCVALVPSPRLLALVPPSRATCPAPGVRAG